MYYTPIQELIDVAVTDAALRKRSRRIIEYMKSKRGTLFEMLIERQASNLDKSMDIVGTSFNIIYKMGRDAVKTAIIIQDLFILPSISLSIGVTDLSGYQQKCLSIIAVSPSLVIKCARSFDEEVARLITSGARSDDEVIARCLISMSKASIPITRAILGKPLLIPVLVLYLEKEKSVATAALEAMEDIDLLL